MNMEKRRLLPRAALIGATMLWGSMFVVSKGTMETIPVMLMSAMRYSAAAILLAVVFHKRVKADFVRHILPGAMLGIILIACSTLQMVGLKYSTPGKTAFLTVVYCVLVPFVFWITDKQRPNGWQLFAAALCLFGIGLISLNERFSIEFGDALVLGCGVVSAIHIVYIAKFVAKYDPILLVLTQFMTSGLISWFAFFLFERGPIVFSTGSVISLIYLSIFPTCLAMLLQSYGQGHVPPSTAGIIFCLESVFGLGFSIIFGDEKLSLRMGIGFAIIFLSIIISETRFLFLRPKTAADVKIQQE